MSVSGSNLNHYKMLSFLEKAYLELTDGKYGVPVITSSRVWGLPSSIGVYEKLNEILTRHGYKKLSWKEFRELLRSIDNDPRFWGVVYTSWVSVKNRV